MAERKSLLDDAAFQNIGKKSAGKVRSSGGMSGDQKKLILAISLFVIAGLVLAFTSGLFDPIIRPTPKLDAATRVQQQELFEQQQREIEERQALDPTIEIGGA